MERFKITCEISHKQVELQFDIKKMPGEVGPCYMVSIDGFFKGYVKSKKAGTFDQLMSSDFTEEEMRTINFHLKSFQMNDYKNSID
ncbi:hypothetical protein BEL04_07960 [Mucilaginibacter sp. PPCGB 2223]|uniref:hypothetical protein n=1 Tax=Mucilaginibacter sp. PPCGB 2223 TaxID=1886027 RepID=UPI00082482FC|nr:hypothetical protein [Mucilaginibacter sp. PPCGB 2223]OCX54186.1 hypothetical protein BEL04_07960 [Mucilaginibacter sp. PPCGB 2223]